MRTKELRIALLTLRLLGLELAAGIAGPRESVSLELPTVDPTLKTAVLVLLDLFLSIKC